MRTQLSAAVDSLTAAVAMQLKQAENDNDVIYNDPVPTTLIAYVVCVVLVRRVWLTNVSHLFALVLMALCRSAEAKSMAKAIEFVNDSKLPDPFASLVPTSVNACVASVCV
jgi:hypothetical protein